MAKVLVIEDDLLLLDRLSEWLTCNAYTVRTETTGQAGIDRLHVEGFDVIILDWELPDISGIELCKAFRAKAGQTPILMLTGRGTIRDKTIGFTAGIDDYLTKPFDLTELTLRIAALLRRPAQRVTDILRFRDIELDTIKRQAFLNGKMVRLQPLELSLLELFMRHPNTPFSTDSILSRVWGAESDATAETVRTYLKQLRRKLDEPGQESIFRTVRGSGYMLDDG